MTTNIIHADAGIADSQYDDFAIKEILAGDTPPAVTDSAIIGSTLAASGLAAWTPVIVNWATGAVTLPVQGTSKPNALTIHSIAAGASASSTVQVWRAGMFNMDAINWGADFDLESERKSAFDLAACQIYVKKPYNVA